jgi:hypothetical protein
VSGARRYRKKPVVIEAVQFEADGSNWRECCEFIEALPWWENVGEEEGNAPPPSLDIETLEGRMKCSPGDFIVRGVKGEHYPCKPDIFEATYEEVE